MKSQVLLCRAWFLLLRSGSSGGAADEMEVQVGNVLVGAAVGDKTVAARFQVKFGDQTLHRPEQIGQEVCVGRGQIGHAVQRPSGDKENVQRVRGARVVKGEEGIGFAEASHRYQKTQIGKGKAEEETPERGAG